MLMNGYEIAVEKASLGRGPMIWRLLAIAMALLLLPNCLCVPVEKNEAKHSEMIKGKICVGTNGRMSVPQNREHHYRNLRDRYTNCTYVDGNLELTWLQDEHIDLSFLQYIREVTGYVLISHVDVNKIVLPRLQIIRGRTLFKLNIQEDEFALLVTLSKMNSLELPGLRDILSGSVGFFNNYNLCHIKTINWEEILTGQNATNIYVYNFTLPERECPPCHKTCSAGCWGEGADNCQKFSKVNCSPQCYQGRCFGPKPRDCCHLFCAGGCTGPKPTDCLACRSVYDDGMCTQECPPMQRYNQITYSWETNPHGKYAYGATCVKNCPDHLLKDSGACVKSCPPSKRALNGECVPCDGPCPKTCKGVTLVHDSNIESFRDCTVIEGSISILDMTFTGFQDIYDNFSIGAVIPPMHPDKLEVFSTLKEVTGYLNIQGYHDKFTSLSYFRNLEVIGGRELTASYFASLYIVKTSLKFLGLTSLKKILSGGVAILENKHMCYTQSIDWKRIKKSMEHGSLVQNNKNYTECERDNEVCDSECSKTDGCWGPGTHRCVFCKHFQYNDRCLPSCDVVPGLYKANDRQCSLCHEECESICNGPGPEHCKLCKHVRDGPSCARVCPTSKYNSSGECRPCHKNCAGGCLGPENTIGPNGCMSCEKAIINGDTVERCLRADENCPDGYYDEWLGSSEQGALKPLAGKAICRRCHPQCKKCTKYGFHAEVCQECANYKRNQLCEEECPPDHFADNATRECIPCSLECRGCYGPDSMHCYSCRNFKILLESNDTNSNSTRFNCTAACPPEFPHKNYNDDAGEPFCSEDLPMSASTFGETTNYLIMVITVVCSALICLCLCFVLKWRQDKRQKDAALKMTMVLAGNDDVEPLHPTNVKPNLAKLRTITEQEIRRGGTLGSGAFGVVYKGFWIPQEERVKIPVAIKVLRDTGVNPSDKASTHKEFLEEAYIMASVDHPNLLKLLAVCMTSQMMLITQLMPLGCLLDYVRKNRHQIGSKPMLNWCTQIARGMSYLEERKMIHRDLAARNVLLQTPNCVKITDFGLAKLLDQNEEAYTSNGGRMPIKWLALECIEHKIFTHKSDVWAFGVTVWELLTYGDRPYNNYNYDEVTKFLKSGSRLPIPGICTTEVSLLMLKCWLVQPESRPSFKELADEFAKMARDPGRFLVIDGDRHMKLPSFSVQDEKEIIRSIAVETGDALVDSEDYLQPNAPVPSCSNIGIPISDSPLPPVRQTWDRDTLRFMGAHPTRLCSLKESDTSEDLSGGSSTKREAQVGGLKLDLPLDDDDYLMPSPQQGQSVTTTAASAAYMDLISDSKQSVSDENQNRMNPSKNFNVEFMPSHACVDNPEYHLVSNEPKLGIPQVPLHPLQHRSSEEESDHEYYNDFDRLRRELQPLRTSRNETTV